MNCLYIFNLMIALTFMESPSQILEFLDRSFVVIEMTCFRNINNEVLG